MICQQSDFQAFKLSDIRTFILSDIQTFRLSNFQTFKLSGIQTFYILHIQTPDFQTFNLSDIQTFRHSNFQTFKLSVIQTFRHSGFQTFRLSDIQNRIYDLRYPAPKDNSTTHAAAAPSNLDAAITMRSAQTELQHNAKHAKHNRTTCVRNCSSKTGPRRQSKKSRF